MLPARNRMRRSTEFDATVRYGVRVAQPDLVVHLRRPSDAADAEAPHIGLVIGKPVGTAVDRHRVARRLRHVAIPMLGDLRQSERVVIRALPSSRNASSARLEQQLSRALRRALQSPGVNR